MKRTWITALCLGVLLCEMASAHVTSRVSVNSAGTQGSGYSFGYSISADGFCVAFASSATNLVPGDTNGHWDVFVRDCHDATTTRTSVSSSGVQGNGLSAYPSISADGRYVAFISGADNLVPGDTNGYDDVFIYDRSNARTTRVSVDSAGAQANYVCGGAEISADGRYVGFTTIANNLVPGDTNGYSDVFVRDRQSGLTTRVSVDSIGTQGNERSGYPSLSADGRYVAFYSIASNLVQGDTNGSTDVFVHDRQSGMTTRVSVDSFGTQANWSFRGSGGQSVSSDGRYVAFYSGANNLVPGDTSPTDVFVHDRYTGRTTRASVDSLGGQANASCGEYGTAISADGRYVAFSTYADDLVPGDANADYDVFLHDCQGGTTTRVSVDLNGADGNSSSGYSNSGGHVYALSANGRYVAFSSIASDLVSNDTNGWSDVFTRNRTLSGVDISASAKLVSAAQWQCLAALGHSCVVVQAWGGRTRNPYASLQLAGARNAGLAVASYCYLNFDDAAPNGPPNQDGYWQVRMAMQAMGAEYEHVRDHGFIAIDVEPKYLGTQGPAAHLQRIGEAVAAVAAAGFPVVIYAKRTDWAQITGDTHQFANIPLWDTKWDGVPDLSVDHTLPWRSYGGWAERLAKQYVGNALLCGIPVDVNVFDSSLFQ